MNNEEGNLREGEILVIINEIQKDHPSKLQQTIKELKEEKKLLKEDNNHILKELEDLNNILLFKLHSNEREKNKEPKLNMEKTTPYKHKGRKLEFSKYQVKSSGEESTKHDTEKHHHYSESSDNNQKKKKYKPYE